MSQQMSIQVKSQHLNKDLNRQDKDNIWEIMKKLSYDEAVIHT